MSTLVELISPTSLTPLSGVKRNISGVPTNVPKGLPAFRGVKNTPGNPIKAPKLSNGNRVDRGTNVVTPVARVTALTSIAIKCGRLSPGDIAFVRRTPGGYLKANTGPSYPGQSAGTSHFTDVFGIDGVNRYLSGTLNGFRAWKLGDNLIDTRTTPINDATDLFGVDPNTKKAYLACLREYRLDGVVLSNEEPYSFNPTEGRDATIFNIGVHGAAPVNNGFLVYDTHAATELYSRGKDPNSYGEALRIGSERAAGTWHGKIGYDFVAAYTSCYTEYPLQMFDRDVRVLDTVYLILRKFNIYYDVVEPRVRVLMAIEVKRPSGTTYVTVPKYPNEGKAIEAVVAGLVLNNADGTKIPTAALDRAKLETMVFFQYMPCSSRAFIKYHETLKLVDDSLTPAQKLTFGDLLYKKDDTLRRRARIGKRYNYAENLKLTDLQNARREAYIANIHSKERLDEHDAVRFLDILMCAGAWKVGKVIDSRSARATPYSNGPTNSSYRMSVVMDIEWLPRNKSIKLDNSVTLVDAKSEVKKLSDSVRRPPAYWTASGRNRAYASKNSNERSILASKAVHTLSERELYEAPLITRSAAAVAAAAAAAAPPAAAPPGSTPGSTPPAATPPGSTPPAATPPVTSASTAPPAPTVTPGTSAISTKQTAAALAKKPVGKPVTVSSASASSGNVRPLATGSSLVDATIAASKKATTDKMVSSQSKQPAPPTEPTALADHRSTGVVDSVFNTIFGASAASDNKMLASPSSPTPSSGSETGPRAYTRRNR